MSFNYGGGGGGAGPQGPAGASFLQGNGIPAGALGEDGDTYLQIDSAPQRLYLKTAGTWSQTGTVATGTGQVIEIGRNGSRTVGDFLRASNVPLTSTIGVAVMQPGTISGIKVFGSVGGGGAGDPIGLRVSQIRAGTEVAAQTVDYTATGNLVSITFGTALTVAQDDAISVQIVSASTGTATSLANGLTFMEVEQ